MTDAWGGQVLRHSLKTRLRKRFSFQAVARFSTLFLTLVVFAFILTPSNPWRRRRRRRWRCLVVQCKVGNWGAWNACSLSCGGGTTTRTRRITVAESCGGRCPYHLTETTICNTKCCPVDCVFTWNAWSRCTGCGTSTQSRTPNIKR